MSSQKDTRWIQRFQSYKKVLKQLEEAAFIKEKRELSNLEKQGMIQLFEVSHELAWKTLKDFLQSRGNVAIYGSRDATREAFKTKLVDDGSIWMEMIESRNLTSHTYDEATANEIVSKVHQSYLGQLIALRHTLQQLSDRSEADD